MSVARKLIPRASGGVIRSGAPWAYRAAKCIAALKALGSETTGTLTITPSRTSCFVDGNVFFEASTTMTTTNEWYNDVIFIWDFDDPYSTYYNMDTDPRSDLIGKTANYIVSPYGAHVWEDVGTYTVKCFAYNTSDSTWEEQSVSITVTDPYDSIPAANRYLVASDGDFTGAPAADNTYTNITTAIQAFNAATVSSMLLLKAGDTITMSAAITSRPNSATSHYVVKSWGSGAQPKVIIDYGGTPFGTLTDIFAVRKCASFTMSQIFWRGLYNSYSTPQMIEGELVAGGYAGGTDTCTDVQILYGGWGGTLASPEQADHITMYNCKVLGVAKAMYSRTGAHHAVVNCNIKEWADYGIFHSYTVGFVVLGNTIRCVDGCMHLGQGKDYTARPREVFHGSVRSEKSRLTLIHINDGFTDNGWFSATTCQPVIRLHTDGASNGGQLPSVVCSNNLAEGGDGPIIFNPANNTLPSAMTGMALIERNICWGTEYQYFGVQTAHAAVIRTNIIVQPDVTRVQSNPLWQSLSLYRNNGDSNGTDTAVWDQNIYTYANTIINMLATQGVGNPYGDITNNPTGTGAVAGTAFNNHTSNNNLSYAPNLASTPVNQVDPAFDGQYLPATPASVGAGSAQVGNLLDFYLNVRSASTPTLGAVEAATTV